MLVGQQMLDVCIVTNVKQGASHVRSATKNVSAQRFRCKGRDVRSSQCCVHSLVFSPQRFLQQHLPILRPMLRAPVC